MDRRDKEALDRYITADRGDNGRCCECGGTAMTCTCDSSLDDEIKDGMLKWAPGSLSSMVIDRIVLDALADMWTDSYRRDEHVDRARIVRFHDRLAKLVTAATGYGDII